MPTDDPAWRDRVRAGGHRITAQREAVLRAVAQLSHPTAEAIHRHLLGDEPTLNQSTVYRNLTVLSDLGLVTHTHLGGGPPVYHLADESPHVHLTCLSCGEVSSVPADTLASLAGELEATTGFRIDPTHAAIAGWCARCRAASGHPQN